MPISRLSSKALAQATFDRFRSNRSWLQNAVCDFALAKPELKDCQPRVLLYGSAVSGTALCDGDADFAIVFASASPKGVEEAAKRVVDIKRDEQEAILADLFRHIGEKVPDSSLKTQRIFRARIPIVQYSKKTADEETIEFDVSLSLDGVKNSLLLRKYMQGDPRLHLGVLCVKQWGREAKILNARRGWISPYALTIMYIHYMISTGRAPGLLDESTVEAEVLKVVGDSATGVSVLEQFRDFNTVVPLEETNAEEVERDVHEFFSFYGSPSRFDFDVSVVDIRKNGTITLKEDWLKMVEDLPQVDRWHLLGHENIMLRDPYESHNLGRSVDFFRGESIREAFRLAGIKKEPLSFLRSA